jgi:hypothetical protein
MPFTGEAPLHNTRTWDSRQPTKMELFGKTASTVGTHRACNAIRTTDLWRVEGVDLRQVVEQLLHAAELDEAAGRTANRTAQQKVGKRAQTAFQQHSLPVCQQTHQRHEQAKGAGRHGTETTAQAKTSDPQRQNRQLAPQRLERLWTASTRDKSTDKTQPGTKSNSGPLAVGLLLQQRVQEPENVILNDTHRVNQNESRHSKAEVDDAERSKWQND